MTKLTLTSLPNKQLLITIIYDILVNKINYSRTKKKTK